MQKANFNKTMKIGLTILLLFSAFSYADNKSLAIAIPEVGYAPYIIIEDNKVFGILAEPLQLAAKKLGIELTFVYAPEKRSRVMLDNHLVDARMESELWVDNPEDYLWSVPITLLEDVFVFHKHSKSNFETEQALIGAHIITHIGYSYPKLQPLFKQDIIHRTDFSTEIIMLNNLIRPLPEVKRAAVMNKSVAHWLIKSTPKFQNRFSFSQRIVDSAPLQFQFYRSNDLAETVKQLNAELIKMKNNKTLDKIASRILK